MEKNYNETVQEKQYTLAAWWRQSLNKVSTAAEHDTFENTSGKHKINTCAVSLNLRKSCLADDSDSFISYDFSYVFKNTIFIDLDHLSC